MDLIHCRALAKVHAEGEEDTLAQADFFVSPEEMKNFQRILAFLIVPSKVTLDLIEVREKMEVA